MLLLPKLKRGDKIAVVSPSFGAAGKWPHMYSLGLSRLRDVFGFEPVELPATKKIGASNQERASDLIAAFEDRSVKAVIASLGGGDQITYIKNLPPDPFVQNPRPFFGFSDNTHFANFLWLNGIPSFYGGSLLPQFAMQKRMDPYTATPTVDQPTEQPKGRSVRSRASCARQWGEGELRVVRWWPVFSRRAC